MGIARHSKTSAFSRLASGGGSVPVTVEKFRRRLLDKATF
jgi:hypothetical protein